MEKEKKKMEAFEEAKKWDQDIVAGDEPEDKISLRDKTRVVSYKAPHNSAVQVYNFKDETARIIFGPDLIVLTPDE